MLSPHIDDPRVVYITLDKATNPTTGLYMCWRHHWWCYVEDRGIIFWKPSNKHSLYPQCNISMSVTQMLQGKLYPWASIKQIDTVFQSHNCEH